MSLKGSILITGGSGSMGRAIIRRANEEEWDCDITIFSTDVMKHHRVKKMYPNTGAIVGDVRDYTTLYNAMVGKDLVLHLAAQKHIPEAEFNSIDNYDVNYSGSLNVCMAAAQLRTPKIIAISTDKVCHAANAYGASKYAMEKAVQEYSRGIFDTSFNLVRFGNVLESTGSVIEVWKDDVENGRPIRVTDPEMTRFFISPNQAVDLIVRSFDVASGYILIPKMKSLSIGELAEYTLPRDFGNVSIQRVPLRPGEKIHETLLTVEETQYATQDDKYFFLSPTTGIQKNDPNISVYSSDISPRLTQTELENLLADS